MMAAFSCSTQQKLQHVRKAGLKASLAVSPRPDRSPYAIDTTSHGGDTLIVKNAEGKDIFIMKAIRDEETGEMVATDVLNAAVVSATFRNVAERGGRIVIDFRITVPAVMTDSRWQMRLQPVALLPGERLPLDEVVVTGESFRKEQLRGYRQYERYLGTLVSDPQQFIRQGQLSLFEERYGDEDNDLTLNEIREHYTDRLRRKRNDRRMANREKVFARYVKTPINEEGERIDTLFNGASELFTYDYSQEILARPGLRKLYVVVSGGIYDGERKCYTIPEGDSIAFYVSSLGTLVDSEKRYLTRVISRRVETEASCRVVFPGGSSDLRRDLERNGAELDSIRDTVTRLLAEEDFVVDSVITTATASPEGSWPLNERLSRARGLRMNDYLRTALAGQADSARFISRSCAEDWPKLARLVAEDSILTARDKRLFAKRMEIADPDRREAAMQRDPSYRYLRNTLYPQLRAVRFDFHLHRRGMQQDTLLTSVVDSNYMAGVQAIRDGAYQQAAERLGRYRDYNTAVAYCSLGKNHTAKAILEQLEQTPKVEYMLAIINSRLGHDKAAIQHYVLACEKNPAYLHRGNLDPEIASLIRKYQLDNLF